MTRRFTTRELAGCGYVSETESEPANGLRRIRYVWRPRGQLESQLPRDFELAMIAIDSSGVRHFRDANGTRPHIFRGFAAGLAVLDRLCRFTRAERNKYRAMFLVYQYVQDTQAHFDCRFRSTMSLVIKPGSRSDDGERSVLPLDLGISATGGRRWTIGRLLEEGTETARAAGISRPSSAQRIAYGLFAAARSNPLQRSAHELRSDIRRALFDTDAIVAAPGRRLTSIVRDRLYQLLDSHLDDCQDDFDKWFLPGGGRNLPRAIGRRCPGGELSNEEVTGALLHLAWEAYPHLSRCLGAFGQAFLAALPEPLSRAERKLFDLSIMPHRYFGGLPRWLLMERIDFLQPALEALMATPGDRELVGTLHRLLTWYPEMVRKRREADRLKQQRRRKRGQPHEVVGTQEIIGRDLAADGELEDQYRRRRTKTGRSQSRNG